MTITKKRLYGYDGVVTVREARTAIDGPAIGTWTPDNLNAGEISGGVVADDVTLDAREWSHVYVVLDFVDGSGNPHAGGIGTVTMLMAVPDANGTNGRRWKEVSTASGLDGDSATSFEPVGHDVAFRLDNLVLSGATSVSIKITGQQRIE